MAKPRQLASGNWELKLHHPLLPGGRKYFYFDTEKEALDYQTAWTQMKMAGIQPPAELLAPKTDTGVTLHTVVMAWIRSGHVAPSMHWPCQSLLKEVGPIRLVDADYAWVQSYVRRLKVENNLAPNSIRHRIQSLSRAIDEYLRNHPALTHSNPVKLLPRGYSTYNDVDRDYVKAANKDVRVDVARDRRLHEGEEERIVQALSGVQFPNKERALPLRHGNAMLTLFLLIANTGLRLKEAYTLRRGWIDMSTKVMRVQCSKQWRGKVAFRDVPIPPAAHAALRTYLSTRVIPSNDYLFPFMTEDGPLDVKTVSSRLSARMNTALAYAGCEDLTEHDLRHEATCRWFELRDRTGNWMFRREEINKIMGWSDNSTMAQRYASFRGSDLAARLWQEGQRGVAA